MCVCGMCKRREGRRKEGRERKGGGKRDIESSRDHISFMRAETFMQKKKKFYAAMIYLIANS